MATQEQHADAVMSKENAAAPQNATSPSAAGAGGKAQDYGKAKDGQRGGRGSPYKGGRGGRGRGGGGGERKQGERRQGAPRKPRGPRPPQSGGAGAGAPATDASGETKTLMVSAQSNPKSVAGSIAHTIRKGTAPIVMATGLTSVNQAVKAMAIARGFLEEDKLDFTVSPIFRDEDKTSVSFHLHKTDLIVKSADDAKVSELRVAATSEPGTVAGAIASKVRAGEKISSVAVGPASVAQTVRAMIKARRYLEDDKIDISFRPEFVKIDGEEGKLSAIKCSILVRKL